MKSLFLADLLDYSESEFKEHLKNDYETEGFDIEKILNNYDIIIAYESVGNWVVIQVHSFYLKIN